MRRHFVRVMTILSSLMAIAIAGGANTRGW
jgi:hypothetical protein